MYMGGPSPGPASPTIFTLPSSLVSIDQALTIILVDHKAPTTSIVAPNLERIGYGNEGNGDGSGLSISGIPGEPWNLTTTSFPALTAIAGQFTYVTVNPLVTTVTGFPLLSTVAEVVGGLLYINGSFANVQLPALTAVGEGILISSTDPSFQCPSNIENSKLVSNSYCIYCGYIDSQSAFPTSSICNSGPNPTPAVGTGAIGGTASTTTTIAAKPTSTGKTSGASALNCAGNRFDQIKLILKGPSIYVTLLLSWGLFHSGLIYIEGRSVGKQEEVINLGIVGDDFVKFRTDCSLKVSGKPPIFCCNTSSIQAHTFICEESTSRSA
jgi:hypothetical protein